jgi:hypothetical protein
MGGSCFSLRSFNHFLDLAMDASTLPSICVVERALASLGPQDDREGRVRSGRRMTRSECPNDEDIGRTQTIQMPRQV